MLRWNSVSIWGAGLLWLLNHRYLPQNHVLPLHDRLIHLVGEWCSGTSDIYPWCKINSLILLPWPRNLSVSEIITDWKCCGGCSFMLAGKLHSQYWYFIWEWRFHSITAAIGFPYREVHFLMNHVYGCIPAWRQNLLWAVTYTTAMQHYLFHFILYRPRQRYPFWAVLKIQYSTV